MQLRPTFQIFINNVASQPESKEPPAPQRQTKPKSIKLIFLKIFLILILLLILGILYITYNPILTLASLEKVDDYPLYVMTYRGSYYFDYFRKEGIDGLIFKRLYKSVDFDACSSFAALNPQADSIFGRNLDWKHRSSLLLYTDAPGAYASVTLVDLSYLGYEGMQEIPWSKRLFLLATPYSTIDGMNEHGLSVGQNAVPDRKIPYDPNKVTMISSQILRLVLDYAKNVDEALELIKQYNIQFPGIPEHFHIADVEGNSVIVEYIDGKIVTTRNTKPWQISTNFLIAEEKPVDANSDCNRYNTAYKTLSESNGIINEQQAMDLLYKVSAENTVWSVVYNMTTGNVEIALGRDYEKIHSFQSIKK